MGMGRSFQGREGKVEGSLAMPLTIRNVMNMRMRTVLLSHVAPSLGLLCSGRFYP